MLRVDGLSGMACVGIREPFLYLHEMNDKRCIVRRCTGFLAKEQLQISPITVFCVTLQLVIFILCR